MLAGVGIVSVVVGLALQDALKDIIMGANIITDNFFSIGDVVKYKGIEGKVISFGLKTTKIQDIATNNILSITNRNIDEIEKVSNEIYIGIPAPYEIKTEKMNEIGGKITERLKLFEKVEDCKYLGLDSLEDSCIIYKIQINCKPEYKYSVKRQATQIIKDELDKNSIDVPYPQMDLHNK